MAANQKKYLNLSEEGLKNHMDNLEYNWNSLKQLVLDVYNESQRELRSLKNQLDLEIENYKKLKQQTSTQVISRPSNTQQNIPVGISINIEQIKQQLGICTQEQLAHYLGQQGIKNSDLILVLLELHERYSQMKRQQTQNDGMKQFMINQKQQEIIENLKKEIENLKNYYDNQFREQNQTLSQQQTLVKNQKEMMYKTQDQFLQIFGLIEQLKNKSVNEKLNQLTAVRRKEFKSLELLIQKLQQEWKELEQNNQLSGQSQNDNEDYIKYLKETISYMKKYVKLSQDFNESLNSIQMSEDNQEIYQIYQQIAQILGNNVEVFKKISDRLDEIMKQQEDFHKNQKNLQAQIEYKENQIKQNKEAYFVEEQKLNEKNKKLENDIKIIQGQAQIDQKQLQQSFIDQQKKKIDNFKHKIRLQFIQFVYEVIQDIVKTRQNEKINQVQFRQNLTEILNYKCPANLDELNQLINKCENNLALESGKFIFSKLKQLTEEIKKTTNEIQQ